MKSKSRYGLSQEYKKFCILCNFQVNKQISVSYHVHECKLTTIVTGAHKEIHITRRGISITEAEEPVVKKSHSDKNINTHFYLDDKNTAFNIESTNRSNSAKIEVQNSNDSNGDLTEKFINEANKNGHLSNGGSKSGGECSKGDNQKCCAWFRNWSVIKLLG